MIHTDDINIFAKEITSMFNLFLTIISKDIFTK